MCKDCKYYVVLAGGKARYCNAMFHLHRRANCNAENGFKEYVARKSKRKKGK